MHVGGRVFNSVAIQTYHACIDYLDLALGMCPNSNRGEFRNIESSYLFYSPLINIKFKYCTRKKKTSDDQTKGKKTTEDRNLIVCS